MTPAPAAAMAPVSVAGRIFERGPFDRFVGLFGGSGERTTVRAAIGLAVLAWLPLLLLPAWAGGSSSGAEMPLRSILTDYGALARYLIVLPLLVVADIVVGARLTGIARYFVESGLVPPQSAGRFEALLASTRAWCGSGWVGVCIAALACLLVAALHDVVPIDRFAAWHRMPGGQATSLAGWWHLAVSAPLLLLFAGGWLWRLLAWTRFLWRAAHLPLRLAAAHPDLSAGLKFVAFSVRDFAPLGVAVGVVFAGAAANRIVNFSATFASLQNVAVGVLIGVLALFGLPLFAFTGRLLREWTMAVHAFNDQARLDEGMLSASDFSAATDLGSYAGNVYGMHLVPLDLKSFVFLAPRPRRRWCRSSSSPRRSTC